MTDLRYVMHVDWTSEDWLRSCGPKVRFPSAKKAAARARKHGMRSYACRYCGGHHLTSK